MANEQPQAWKGQTFGNRGMHVWLTRVLRWVDVRFIYAFAGLFVVPVCLVLPNSLHGYRFLRQALGMGRLRALCAYYRNMLLFSQVVIDRFAMYGGRRFDVQVRGYEHFQALAQGDEGFVQLSAHVGNYELAGYSLVAKDKRMNALVYGGEKQTVMDERAKLFGSGNIRMIAVSADMSHLFHLNSALAAGEIVSMPADRIVGSPKRVEVEFFGRRVSLPMGPFQVAAMRGVSVLAVNVMKTSVLGYTAYVAPITYDAQAPRKEQIRQLAQGYAQELERTLKQHPHQWYNYYDFWKQ